jgi:nucleotidyltransferase/DNA polymerase involved in DNA repair
MTPDRVIAHIDMDAFFAAVEQRDNPALRGRPVIVGADPKGGAGRGVVATCSYEARRFGVHSAQPISVAYKKCPGAVFIRGQHEKYSRESRRIRRILEDFTPEIEPVSIDEAFLDLTGSYHFYRSARGAAEALRGRILRDTGLTASVGVAPVKFVAKIASDLCKPDGLLVVPPKDVGSFLRPLPVGRLWGVGPKNQAVLNSLGISTVGELARFSQAALIKKMGECGARLYQLARGIDPRPVLGDEDVKSVSHEHTFEEDQGDFDPILKTIFSLTEQVSRRLRKDGLKGRSVSVKIRTQGFVTRTRARTLPCGVNLIDDIYPVAEDLFRTFFRPGMRVRLVGVRVARFEDLYVRDSLFEDESRERKDRVQTAMELIKDKFGERAIRRGF